MKAIVCSKFGQPETLEFKTIEPPVLKKGEVRIAVKACSANFPDTLIIQNLYQFKPELPFSPGGEISGVVLECSEEVKNLKVGDKVFALCGWGGFAEEINVEASKVFPMIPGMDYVTAASVMYNYGTSYHALKDRAQLQKGETLLVLGAAGGVGLAAVELGVLMGANVIAAASSNEKLEICKAKGAKEVINYETEDLRGRIKEITNGKGVDVVYDPVGGKFSELALRSIAWKGRFLVVGFAAGEIPQIALNLALLKGASIQGVFWGRFTNEEAALSRKNLEELAGFLLTKKITPHIHKLYSLKESPAALRDLMDRKVVGKAVIIMTEEKEAKDRNIGIIQKSAPKKVIETEDYSKRFIASKEELFGLVGQEIGKSEWLKIDQEMITKFAEVTKDNQWIHIDENRAKLSPFGSTIAHGYLTLSLVSYLMENAIENSWTKMGINYGCEKVRFISPVLSGDEIRLVAKLKKVDRAGGVAIKMYSEISIEIRNKEKLACHAEIIAVLY